MVSKNKSKQTTRKNKSRVLKPVDYVSGFSDDYYDELQVALKPGKRRSKSGNIYYEYRKNRADLDGKMKLKTKKKAKKTTMAKTKKKTQKTKSRTKK